MGALPSVWLSYNDIAVEGSWQWATGCTNSGYTHWDTQYHEPNGGTNENCVEMYAGNVAGRGWNDAVCNGGDVNYPKYCFCQAGVTYVGDITGTPVPSIKPTRQPTRKPTREPTSSQPICFPHRGITVKPTRSPSSIPTFNSNGSTVQTDDRTSTVVAPTDSNSGEGGVAAWLIVGATIVGFIVLVGGTYAIVTINQCSKRAAGTSQKIMIVLQQLLCQLEIWFILLRH